MDASPHALREPPARPIAPPVTAAPRDPRLPWIVAIAAMLPFLGWWTYGLFDLDEGIYAAIVGEMIRRHEWITPYFNGAPWYEKPILIYWAAIPFVKLLGPMVGPRVSAILATWGTMGLVAWFSRRHLAPGSALIAPLVLATSLLVVGTGRLMITDPLLVLCLTAALVTFWESLTGDVRWRWVAGLALGFGVLAKGPVAIAFFVIIAVVTWYREPALRSRFRGGWLVAGVAAVAVMALWYGPIYLATRDDFVRGFLYEQNVARFLGGDTAHTVPWYLFPVFYLPVILLGMFPWSLYIWRAWPRRIPGVTPESSPSRFLQTWAVTVVAFFTAAGSKLPHYMLPAIVPLAVLVAHDCATRWGPVTLRTLVRPLLGTVVMAAFAHLAFTGYYGGLTVGGRVLLPGFHAELHQLAGEMRTRIPTAEPIVEYQMGRQARTLPRRPGEFLSETTHPSLQFYLDRTLVLTDSLARLLEEPKRSWIITRWNRMDSADVARAAAAGRTLERITVPFALDYYTLWTLGPLRAAP